jgi:hypothetical protein
MSAYRRVFRILLVSDPTSYERSTKHSLTYYDIDQLTVKEIIQVAEIVQSNYKNTPLKFNVITLKVDKYSPSNCTLPSRTPSSPSTSPGVMATGHVRTAGPSLSSC